MKAESTSKLAEVLGALAIQLQAQRDAAAILRGIVDAAGDIVPGARWAGISVVHGRRVQSEVPTHPIVAELDQLQTDRDWPCVSVLREHHTVHIEDMSAETRWPRFVQRAMPLGVQSKPVVISNVRSHREPRRPCPLRRCRRCFTDESLLVGGALAQHAAVPMAGATAVSQLRSALASHDLIR
jgi:hypothetical protein